MKFKQALALFQKGQLDQARALFEEIGELHPGHFDALNLLGVIAAQTGNYPEAIELLGRALRINPNSATAHYNLGIAQKESGKLEAALESYQRAITLKPDYAEACYARGNALTGMAMMPPLVMKPPCPFPSPHPSPASGRGGVSRYACFTLSMQKRLNEALDSYDQALALKPDYAEAFSNRGNILKTLKRLDAALHSYEQAIALKPDHLEAWFNRGMALKELRQLDAAVSSFNQVIALKADYTEAYVNRGHVQRELKQLEAAITSYDQALALKPDYPFLYGLKLYTKMHICDWTDSADQFARLEQKIQHKASPPFPVVAMKDSPSLQRKAAELWIKEVHPASTALPPISKHTRAQRIRLGYFSADFRSHAVSTLIAGLFENHDRTKFELTAFSFGPDTQDEMRKRIEVAFDQFLDVRNKSDQEIAELARNCQLDIAIDLGGFTQESRTGIFAFQAAPIQVNYLGYPGTMGAPYIDYLIADSTLIPEASRKYYAEKIIYLPDSYQVNDAKRATVHKIFTREALGLPDSGFVFCCFNNNFKIMPQTFDSWMRILRQVDGSVLWLFEDNVTALANLRNQAEKRGVKAQRLIFAKRLSQSEHLARHCNADLFLDTLPYNAHTTASDALWAGLPVLTCIGESFASRVAASLLNAINLPELITSNQQEFETLAIALATNPARLEQLRQKLENNRLVTPLFDTRSFTRHLEDAYLQMVDRYQLDLPPEHIHVRQALTQDAVLRALLGRGLALHQQGQLAKAQVIFEEILKQQPKHFDALHLLGVIAAQTNDNMRAVELIGQALPLSPNNAAAHYNLGNALKALQQWDAAVKSYGQAIALASGYTEAFYNRGIALQELGRLDEACDSFERAIALKPDYAEAHFHAGNIYNLLGKAAAALKYYQRAIELKPDYAEAHLNCGNVLKALDQPEAAVISYQQAVTLRADYAAGHFNLGIALLEQAQFAEALKSFDRVITLKPSHAEACFNRGAALHELRRLDEAVLSYDQALLHKPDYAQAFSNRGLALYELNRLDEALDSYAQAIALKPDYAEAYSNRGITFKALGQLDSALTSYQQAIALEPDYAEAHFNQSLCYLQLGNLLAGWKGYEWRWKQKKTSVRKFTQPRWSGTEALAGKSILLYSEQGLGDTLQFCRYVRLVSALGACVFLEVPPTLKGLLTKLEGVSQIFATGEELPMFDYQCPLLSLPAAFNTELHNIPAPLRYLNGKLDKLTEWQLKLGTQHKPRLGLVWRGNAMHQNDSNRSIPLSDFIRLLPDGYQYISLQKEVTAEDQQLLDKRSDILYFGKQLQDFCDTAALCECMDCVVSVDTSVAHLAAAMGIDLLLLLPFNPDWRWMQDRADSPWYPTVTLYRQHQPGAWERVFEQLKNALQSALPGRPEAHLKRGLALKGRGQYQAALAHYELALAQQPDYTEAYLYQGNAYSFLKQRDAAIKSYDQALLHQPDFELAHFNRGIVLQELKRLTEAAQSFDRAFALNPEHAYLFGMRLHTLRQICDWQQAASDFSQLELQLLNHQKVALPFPVLALTSSLTLQRKAAEIWVNDSFPATMALAKIPRRSRHEKIRLGYFSADFRNHPSPTLLLSLYETHDRTKFEVIAFSFGPDTGDKMRKKLEGVFDKFIDVKNQTDLEIVQLARRLEIDIAIDLMGFTANSRTGIFALGAAPLQVNYLGYPGTMGARYIDYIIADNTVITDSSHYAEKIVSLPGSYYPTSYPRYDPMLASTPLTRNTLGLPEQGFVFCCFNNNFKITPATFDGWMRILQHVEGSVLWLLEDNVAASGNLRKEAENRGVTGERLIFAKRLPMAEHMARHLAADLFLDTLPYNAHTTASDALWAGLPVLTCLGDAFASRVAASLLKAIDLPELITATQQEFEAQAIALATQPERLNRIKQQLQHNRLCTPLFDSRLYARHIEAAYRQMMERYYQNLPPAPIQVTQQIPVNVADWYEQAVRLQEAAKFNPAKALYQKILEAQPDHFAALHRLGVAELQTQHYQRAVQLLDQAIRLNPDSAAAYSNRGNALKNLGHIPAAIDSYDQALKLKPDFTEVYYNRGNALKELKQFEAAINSYDRAIELRPAYREAYYNRGNAQKELRQLEAAVNSYEQAILLKPAYVEALYNLGNTQKELGRFEEAVTNYQRAIAIKPSYAQAHYNLGNAYQQLKQLEAAQQCYEQAVKIDPAYADAHASLANVLHELNASEAALLSYDRAIALNPECAEYYCSRGSVLQELKQSEAAVASYEQAIALKPDFSVAYSNRGAALQTLKQFEAALASYDRAIALNPTYAEAFYNRGTALKELKRFGDAVQSYQQAIELKADYANAHWNQSLCYLQLGNFAPGWKKYEWRWEQKSLKPGLRKFAQPLWLGDEPLAGKRILLHSEQGLGDTLQFCRYAKQVNELGAEVILQVQPALLTLLENLQGVAQLLATDALLPTFDSHCPLLSLPGAFNTLLENIPAPSRYLTARADKLKEWSLKLGAQTRPRIGLVWSGNSLHSNDHNRSIPLKDFISGLPEGYQYVSLQRELKATDQTALDSSTILHFGTQLQDFSDTAALCELMDLVISVDTSVAHLAGAMSRPIYILLPVNSDWRWMQHRRDSPWYPSATLYRQERPGDWQAVFEQLRSALQAALPAAAPQEKKSVDHSFQRGLALQQQGQFSAAAVIFEAIHQRQPNHFDALHMLGVLAAQTNDYPRAVNLITQALKIIPDSAAAHYNLGIALKELKQPEAALKSYAQAIALQPTYAEAYASRGNLLKDLKQLEAAVSNYDQALALKPAQDFLYGMRLHTQMQICDWRDVENQFAQLALKIQDNERVTTPFIALAITDSLSLQLKAAEIWIKTKYPENHALPKIPKRPRHPKIRIGYFSADFRNHPGAWLMAGLFDAHDRNQFEVTAFSFGPDTRDEMRKRLEGAFDQFIDVSNKSDREIAELARCMEIDIAINRSGHTLGSRTGIFALRAAPIQASYLAYPGTVGAPYMDYLIADHTLIPETSQPYYCEKIAYLPDSYMVTDDKRRIADKNDSRKELGLPAKAFVFCCFNSNYKITPQTFAGWMRILKQVKGSVLWLFEDNAIAAKNLRLEAAKMGVKGSRLIFAKRMLQAEHLARHRAADLFLDTLPCNAHTTACDALWAGLPVLTCLGEAFASRVAASLLKAIDLPELITTTQPEYEALAVTLATHPARLNQLKQKLQKNRLDTPLFNTRLFARHIEDAYTQMVERYQLDLPPANIQVLPYPQDIAGKLQRGLTLHQQGRLADAATLFEEILQQQPGQFDALHLLGVIAAQTNQDQKSVALIRQAIANNPDNAAAHSNLGNALKQLGQADAAIKSYQRAIALQPDYADAHLNLSLCLLQTGAYANGWKEYQWRWEKAQTPPRKFTQPLWLGAEPLSGKRILLYSEQGLGDTLQFCRYTKQVSELGAQVILQVQPPLQGLLASLEGVSQLLATGDALPAFDYHCPLLSLPLAFKTVIETIPNTTPYLKAHKLEEWRLKLGVKTKPRIGLVWSGSKTFANDHNRSIPLADILKFLPDGYQLLSLQKEVRTDDLQTLQSRPDILHFGGQDFCDTAALCELMDVVISVDTSVAHLAGALARKVYILLPAKADWRWLQERNDSPWYPTATLYRQTQLGDWDAVFAQLKRTLTAQLPATTGSTTEQAKIYPQALALHQAGKYSQAESLYQQILEKQPENFEALHMLGVIALQTRQFERAVQLLDQAIALNPHSSAACCNRGNALRQLKRLEEAVQSYDLAIALRPDFAEAFYNRGNALKELKQLAAAISSYTQAISIKPAYAEAMLNCGNVHKELKQLELAIQYYAQAIALKPDYVEAHYNCAHALSELQRPGSAITHYERAFALKPDYPFLLGILLHARIHICDWREIESQIAQCELKLAQGEKVSLPFPVLALTGSLPLQRKAAEIWNQDKYPTSLELPAIAKRTRQGKIRIGYYSADFHNHATAYLMTELFELHDANQFERFAFSFGPDIKHEMRDRVANAFDQFSEVRMQSDLAIAQLSRKLEIDIAIDLKGFTQDNRAGIFAMRAAPIQVSYLGYPGTMGAPYMDYLIADSTLIPEFSQSQYAEKIIYLPNSYQVNDRKRVIAAQTFSRQELSLPAAGFIYCCFNNHYKITPNTFAGWMRILKQVAGSVLWLLEDNPLAADNLRRTAEKSGVAAERLIFAQRMPLALHLARHRVADLFLDTLPYNAHTTASDALWAGLPVLTCMGAAFASRVAASLLNAVGLPELVVDTQQEYERLAITLAADSERLNALKQKLLKNLPAAPLFDTRLFTRHIEAAYTLLMERYHADLPPATITVPPILPSGNLLSVQSEIAAELPVWYFKAAAKKENLGDYLGCYMLEKLSQKPSRFVTLESGKPVYITVGSVLHAGLHEKCLVWGSGFISEQQVVSSAVKLFAVRGKLTQDRLRSLGCAVPEPLGDPALLMPYLYQPKPGKNKLKLGIIPHYQDSKDLRARMPGKLDKVSYSYRIFNILSANVEEFIDNIVSCEFIVSSSLHGLILAHAYKVPALWVNFSGKLIGGSFKFHDYFSSVGLPLYPAFDFRSGKIDLQAFLEIHAAHRDLAGIVNFDPVPLLDSCPFLNENIKSQIHHELP